MLTLTLIHVGREKCVYWLQGSHRDLKTWKMKMVIEKSWNMKKWQKVMEFYQFSPQFVLNFLITTKKLSSDLESLHFLIFSAKCHKFKIEERDGHGKLKKWSWKNILSSLWEPCCAPLMWQCIGLV